MRNFSVGFDAQTPLTKYAGDQKYRGTIERLQITTAADEKSAAGVRTRRGHEQKSDPHNGPARRTRFPGIAQSGPRLRLSHRSTLTGPLYALAITGLTPPADGII